MKRLLISFSGGRTSAYMTFWLLNKWHERNGYEILTVFANTGKEKEQTLEFVEECSSYFNINVVWVEAIINPVMGKGVEAKVVDFKTASRNGEPFRAMIAKYGIPNQNSPHCSKVLKKQTIRAYARAIGWEFSSYRTAIGIRADEPQRIDWEKAKRERLFYPLVLTRDTKFDINKFWSQQPYDLKLKSYQGNCDLCWKKSDRKLFTILKEDKSIADWWRQQENDFGSYIPESRQHNEKIKAPLHFFRKDRSVEDLIEEADFDFKPAEDESQLLENIFQMALWEKEMDANEGCVESCEAF